MSCLKQDLVVYKCFFAETGPAMPHNLDIIMCALMKMGSWVTAESCAGLRVRVSGLRAQRAGGRRGRITSLGLFLCTASTALFDRTDLSPSPSSPSSAQPTHPHPGKLPAVTHTLIFMSAHKMMSWLHGVAGPVSAKNYCKLLTWCIHFSNSSGSVCFS